MNYFLVDYENVNVSGLKGISKLTENDVVVIFYSENANTLTFGMHKQINDSKAKIEFQRISAEVKNALDFQLCSYLGYLIRDSISGVENPKNNYYIVSNDSSYSILPNYWKKFGAEVKIIENLSKGEVIIAPTLKTSSLETELNKVLSNKNEVTEILQIIDNSEQKTDIHNKIVKKFGENGKKIYQSIKAFIANKK